MGDTKQQQHLNVPHAKPAVAPGNSNTSVPPTAPVRSNAVRKNNDVPEPVSARGSHASVPKKVSNRPSFAGSASGGRSNSIKGPISSYEDLTISDPKVQGVLLMNKLKAQCGGRTNQVDRVPSFKDLPLSDIRVLLLLTVCLLSIIALATWYTLSQTCWLTSGDTSTSPRSRRRSRSPNN